MAPPKIGELVVVDVVVALFVAPPPLKVLVFSVVLDVVVGTAAAIDGVDSVDGEDNVLLLLLLELEAAGVAAADFIFFLLCFFPP